MFFSFGCVSNFLLCYRIYSINILSTWHMQKQNRQLVNTNDNSISRQKLYEKVKISWRIIDSIHELVLDVNVCIEKKKKKKANRFIYLNIQRERH